MTEETEDLQLREKRKADYVSGQIFDQAVYNLISADERAGKRIDKGLEPDADFEPEFNLDELPDKNSEPLGLPNSVAKLPIKKSVRYKWPVKPIPYAVSMDKIHQVLADWRAWNIKPIHKYYYECAYLFAPRATETVQARQQDFEIVSIEGMEFLQGKFLTLKTRKSTNLIRNPLAPFDGPEGKIVEDFANHLNRFSPSEKLFDLDRKTAWHLMHRIDYGPLQAIEVKDGKKSIITLDEFYTGSHYLRHVRLTHLKTYHHFDDLQLTDYVGWADPRMASRYVHLDVKDQAAAFKRSIFKA